MNLKKLIRSKDLPKNIERFLLDNINEIQKIADEYTADLNKNLKWYKKEFGKWESGEEVESIISANRILMEKVNQLGQRVRNQDTKIEKLQKVRDGLEKELAAVKESKYWVSAMLAKISKYW